MSAAVESRLYESVRGGRSWCMTYDIPPLRRLEETPPIKTQEDLCQFWRSLMGALGFSRRHLWVITMDDDGYVQPGMVQVDECPVVPDPGTLRALVRTLREVIDDDPQRRSIAFLWSRPGGAAARETDLAWAVAINDAVRAAMIPTWPVHLATDYDLRVFSPDELAA